MFLPILNQMIVLFAFIVIGYLLSKCKVLPQNTDVALSKLENVLLVPAMILATFIDSCTLEKLASTWKTLTFSLILLVILFPLSYGLAKWLCKEDFLRKATWYGLLFSNFGFMGNAIVKVVFPEIFFEYTIFIMPFWLAIYLWAVPALLMEKTEEKRGWKSKLKTVFNPMFIATLLGLLIGLTGLQLPTVITSVVNVAGDCMSPIAMMLTGIIIAKADVLSLIKQWRLYVISAIRICIFPLLYIGVCALLPKGGFLTESMLVCGMMMTCLSMGLNAVVVPAAYGKDTSQAAGLALISSVFSIGTIPLMFWIFQTLVL